MKKTCKWYWKRIVAGVFLLLYAASGWINKNGTWKVVDTAARMIAGEGMQKLVQDTFDHKLAQECARAFRCPQGLAVRFRIRPDIFFMNMGRDAEAVRCARRRGFPMRTVSAPITME